MICLIFVICDLEFLILQQTPELKKEQQKEDPLGLDSLLERIHLVGRTAN